MINLFVNTYSDKSEQRQQELMECLALNKKSFDRVIVINNTPKKIKGVVNIMTAGRPTFNDFFAAINEHSREYDINVVANSDILFPKDSLKKLAGIRPNDCYALSRYNNGALFMRHDSQDAWVFRGWIKHVENAAFNLGEPGSDNAIAHRLASSGYTVTNPCFDVATHHNHGSNVRNYSARNRIPQPYLHVYPTDLDGCRRFYATSINPYDRVTEQLSAVRTWKSGRVISFNTAKEIADIGKVDGVTFVEIGGNDVYGGKYPKIHSILKWMRHLDFDRFVVINSDIAIADMTVFNRLLLSPNFVMGVRHDDGVREFPHGFDVFAFTGKQKDCIRPTDFSLGMPWWDFYVPLSLIKDGHKVEVVRDTPLFRHRHHETRYNYEAWTRFGNYARELSVFPAFGRCSLPEYCTYVKNYIDSKLITVA